MSTGKHDSGAKTIQPIAENDEEAVSGAASGKMPRSRKIDMDASDDDDIGRSPDPIDLANVNVSKDSAF